MWLQEMVKVQSEKWPADPMLTCGLYEGKNEMICCSFQLILSAQMSSNFESMNNMMSSNFERINNKL